MIDKKQEQQKEYTLTLLFLAVCIWSCGCKRGEE